MSKFSFKKEDYIKNKVNCKQLTHIILETGKENIFIAKENKFIVTQDFVSHKPSLLEECETLVSIDLTNLDFTEIETMECWFCNCFNLAEIKFPNPLYCPKLKSLFYSFSGTKIKELNMSKWIFGNQLVDLSFATNMCKNLEELYLPNVVIKQIHYIASNNTALKKVCFGANDLSFMENFYLSNKVKGVFNNCLSLTMIDCSRILSNNSLVKSIFNKDNIYNVPNNCIVVLPE